MKHSDGASFLLRKMSGKKLKNVADAIFASKCAICDRPVKIGDDLCPICETELPLTNSTDFCIGCGKTKDHCICSGEFFLFEALVSPFLYTGGISECIARIKFHSRIDPIPFLARHMAQKAIEVYSNSADYITYVPLSKEREAQRGFDQSKLLAQEVSRLTGIPFEENVITKVYDTPEQHKCTDLRRKGNLLGAYDVDLARCIGKTVLLIDDVSTTGATFNECAKMLKVFGALHVLCLCAAVAIRENDGRNEEIGK